MESQRSEVKEGFIRTTTRHDSKQSNIHHTSSPELSFFCFFILCAIEFQGAHLPCSTSAVFLNIMAHIYKIMKTSNYVVWPASSSKFLKMARGPKSLATPGLFTLCIHNSVWFIIVRQTVFRRIPRKSMEREPRAIVLQQVLGNGICQNNVTFH